ncbi:hypothetical protein K474DRAFT_1666269 [Panus rudis PR-1116 ss-1]|nr:hypothetical protein K474DRAFT_1666269 [Panus rudis PR-1116 ss-1]
MPMNSSTPAVTAAPTAVIHLTPKPNARRSDDHDALYTDIYEFWWTTSSSSASSYVTPSIPDSGSGSGSSELGSGSGTAIPNPTPTSSASHAPSPDSSDSSSLNSNSLSGSDAVTTITSTSSIPITITSPSTTFTSFSTSVSVFTSTRAASAFPDSQSSVSNLQRVDPVCIGEGVDSLSVGLLATVIVPSVIGFFIWLLFAIIRPRFREIYALREWFVQQSLRPKPLSRSLTAFLFPPVPLVPPIPTDSAPETTRSPSKDAHLFPSDEALSQRTLWVCLLIVLGWSLLGLAGLLPLYMVETPCLRDSAAGDARFVGAWSLLQDMSLLRVLKLLDEGDASVDVVGSPSSSFVAGFGNTSTLNLNALQTREIVNGKDYTSTARTRLIILTIFTIVLSVLPVLYKIIKEFNILVAHRKRWVDVKCAGMEMGWLSAKLMPGFQGWGEKRVKEFVVKCGLSSELESGDVTGNGVTGNGGRGGGARSRRRRRRRQAEEWSSEEKANLEVDVTALFSIGDTTQLALLIDERDEILENLEIAETKYINSFKLSTPDPSIADFVPIPPPQTNNAHDVEGSNEGRKVQISRPKPLAGSSARRRRRGRRNPAFGSSSLPPTSYVMPSQYYKLRGVSGVTGGQFTSPASSFNNLPSSSTHVGGGVGGGGGAEASSSGIPYGGYPQQSQYTGQGHGHGYGYKQEPSFTDSWSQRVVGSRFQEVKRDSVAYGRLPMGSQIVLEKNGQMGLAPAAGMGMGSQPQSPMHDSASYNPGIDGPNAGYTSWDTEAFNNEGYGPGYDPIQHSQQYHSQHQWYPSSQAPETIAEEDHTRSHGQEEEEWVDVMRDTPEVYQHGEEYPTQGNTRRPRPPRQRDPSPERRETFPLRNKATTEESEQPPPHLRLQPRQPFVRPLSGIDHANLGEIYNSISHWRSKLKAINAEIADVQRDCYNEIAEGTRIKGWLLVGRGLHFIPGVQMIEGRAKEDVRWDELQSEGGFLRGVGYWVMVVMVAVLLGAALTAVAGLCIAAAPDVAHYLPFFEGLITGNTIASGVASGLAAAVAATLFISIAIYVIHWSGHLDSSPSISGSQLSTFKRTFYVLTIIALVWLFGIGAVLISMDAFNSSSHEAASIANGTVYMSAFAMMLVMNVAVIFPGLLLLQPVRLWRVVRAEREAVTPRQRFRAVYPRTYDPTYATGCCVLAVLLATAFSLIFPLLAPAAVILLGLSLIAHRFLVGYVYGRTHSQTGGLLSIWLLKRFGTTLALQPLILGLILLSRRLWIEGGILCGTAFLVAVFVEIYCSWKMRVPGRRSLSNVTRESLDTFMRVARPTASNSSIFGSRRTGTGTGAGTNGDEGEESTSLVSSGRTTRARGSFASILEMMSLTLAVMPSPSQTRGPVPLETETLDDLTATERAARTHPDAPPHLPPLPFADHAEEMAGILYAPELLAPPPVIWLPNDVGGIGRSEAYDLQRYHNLQVTLDVRSKDDVPFGHDHDHDRDHDRQHQQQYSQPQHQYLTLNLGSPMSATAVASGSGSGTAGGGGYSVRPTGPRRSSSSRRRKMSP